MHPHPNDNKPLYADIDYYTIITIIVMMVICWPAVIIFMLFPWCLGVRQKMSKSITEAIDKARHIGYLYVTAWIIVSCLGWIITIYYTCF